MGLENASFLRIPFSRFWYCGRLLEKAKPTYFHFIAVEPRRILWCGGKHSFRVHTNT